MTFLQKIAVFFWMLPVIAQIGLPLALLLGWSVKKVLTTQFSK